MRDFKQLKVWQKAHRLVLDLYRHTRTFPAEERYALTAHLLKSATSVPSNIAEGCGRDSETEYQLLLARDLGYLTQRPHHDLDAQVNEVKRMLNAFIQRLT